MPCPQSCASPRPCWARTTSSWPQAAREVLTIGHSSGSDLLGGLLGSLEALACSTTTPAMPIGALPVDGLPIDAMARYAMTLQAMTRNALNAHPTPTARLVPPPQGSLP